MDKFVIRKSNTKESELQQSSQNNISNVISISSFSKKSNQPILPLIETKNQPSSSFIFPKHKNRSFCAKWFETFTWLHYDTSKDRAFCFDCISFYHKTNNKLNKHTELSFIVDGFKNWKKASEKLRSHENSKMHVNSIHYLLSINSNLPVISLLSKQKIEEQKNASTALLTIISTLRYLSQMGLSIRGHSNNDGNFISLLEERSLDVPCLRNWIQQKNNWLSSDIQNEILEIMSLNVQRELVKSIKTSEYFSIIADSTTDISSAEQFSLCIRYVDSNFEVHELFTGLYNTPDSKALTFFDTIKDILIRFTLSTSNLRGHCFDGAANMSGKLNGVKKLIEDVQPKSCFVHCSNHSLDLALQEVARKNISMCDIFTMVRDVSNAILESAKRKSIYENIVLEPCYHSSKLDSIKQNLLPFCPTRWSVRVKSLIRFLDNYSRVQKNIG
ncbi:zinc finger MYM-type protein 1-like [Melanaphis sacchari]|uniref:zinc finger MYM-type protein 1-like n=1 Tax=Melanaphis sacchari TaxID=742174 RepID=UPI000DC12EAE|nr:zinc finger MYM-type protein 1-like [Melanaphis sacchari]